MYNVANQGYEITEEAARLIIKWHRKPRFGQMDARSKSSVETVYHCVFVFIIVGGSWKMRLYTFNQLLSHSTQLASGSYQNVFSYENRYRVYYTIISVKISHN